MSKDERYSPKHWFDAFDVEFDLDPCAPVGWENLAGYHVPAKRVFTIEDDGLNQDWDCFVFMNPPFGGRNEIVPWLEKFIDNGQGHDSIGVCWGRTASGWFQKYMKEMDYLLFVENKKQFVMPNDSPCGCAKDGVVLYGIGEFANRLLAKIDNGLMTKVLR